MGPFNILLVDDEPSVCDLLAIMLEDEGHRVTCATGGRQALRLLKTQRFDVAIADILMPEFDGIELITAMKKEQLPVPVVAISGGGHVSPGSYLQLARGVGAAATLGKPFNKAELLAAIEEAKA